jgi:endonuclease/exonuclease/phosphatase family metal-dependent hydrolase
LRAETAYSLAVPAPKAPLLLLLLLACVATPPARPEPRAPLAVRVMTFNLRWDGFDDGAFAWEHRRDLACRVIRAFEPDSVGTQEPMIRQIADVTRAIPTLSVYRFDNDPKYVRTQQILYRNDRFERVDAGGFRVADGRDGDGTIRFCTWVLLEERATGRRYYHYNVHLDHRDLASRKQSVVRLMKHIAARGSDDPFVITGDFNTGEHSPPMEFLRGAVSFPDDDGGSYGNPIPLVDTFRVLHPDATDVDTACGFRGKRRGGQKIDHVLVAKGAAKVREAAIVRTSDDGRFASDHFPVTAVFEWD